MDGQKSLQKGASMPDGRATDASKGEDASGRAESEKTEELYAGDANANEREKTGEKHSEEGPGEGRAGERAGDGGPEGQTVAGEEGEGE